ncbi:hypothetical protein [Mycolicibacterium sp.]|uniref:hypothetical protein n=1 Tax=Mycolicibacterium sp. TaxID=2320850 RepID=UPI003D14ED30
MWITIAKIALIAFLIGGCAALVVVYQVRRRRGITGWAPTSVSRYSEALGGSPPPTPLPEWVHWTDDQGESGGPPPGESGGPPPGESGGPPPGRSGGSPPR